MLISVGWAVFTSLVSVFPGGLEGFVCPGPVWGGVSPRSGK